MEASVLHDIPPLAIFLALSPEMGHITISGDINNFFYAAFSEYRYEPKGKKIWHGPPGEEIVVTREYSSKKFAWNIANVAAIVSGVCAVFFCATLILPPAVAGFTILSVSVLQYAAILPIIGIISLSIKAYVCRFDEKMSQHQGEDWDKAMKKVYSSDEKPKIEDWSSSSESTSEYPNDL
jgi:hypothetical protein